MRFLLLTFFGCMMLMPTHAEELRGAHLQMEQPTHDFGDVPRKGGDLEKEFVFINDGDVPLVVTRVITSCSCLKATYPKRPVAPGERGVIRIIYEPHKSEAGAFNKVIQIYSNSVDCRDVITVQGNSIEQSEQTKLRDGKLRMRNIFRRDHQDVQKN